MIKLSTSGVLPTTHLSPATATATNGISSVSPHTQRSHLRHIPHFRIDNDDLIFKKYEFGRKLGQGSFGTVYELVNKESKQKYAVKIISKEKAGKAVLNFENEVLIMKSVTHPNLIQLEEVYENKKKLYLVTEICETGELAKWIKRYGPIREDKSKLLMRKIVDAISYLHKHDIVHRDLKLENILIKQYDELNDTFDIKITDFGLSSQRETVGTDSMFNEYCGTPLYMAPEIIDNFPYSQLCDVWSLGIIMYIILIGRSPFNAESDTKLREQIRRAEFNTALDIYNELSDEAKDCIQRMVKVNPAHRITSSELGSHPWLLDKRLCEIEQKNVLELMSEMLQEQENRSPQYNRAIESAISGSKSDTDLKGSLDKKSSDHAKKSSNIKSSAHSHNSSSTLSNSSSSAVHHKHLKFDSNTNIVKNILSPSDTTITPTPRIYVNSSRVSSKLPFIDSSFNLKFNSSSNDSSPNRSLDKTTFQYHYSRCESPIYVKVTSNVQTFLPKLQQTPDLRLSALSSHTEKGSYSNHTRVNKIDSYNQFCLRNKNIHRNLNSSRIMNEIFTNNHIDANGKYSPIKMRMPTSNSRNEKKKKISVKKYDDSFKAL